MRAIAVSLALIAALLLPACSRLGGSPEIASHTLATSPAEKAYTAGAAALRDGNYERALDQFTVSWKESPDNPALSRDFVAALEGLKRSGDEASRQGVPEEAGKKWTAALRHVGHPATKGKALSFSRSDLKGTIDRLSSAMMEKGLKEYQMGNIEAAIEIWRSILAYDPGNQEAARSIRTATTQLENLKKLAPPK